MNVPNAPTMLIGLGGLGCQVIDMVYGRIPQARRQGVGVHGFDTDVGSIKKLKYLDGHVTQTSTREMVGEYIFRQPIVNEWFPNNRILFRKSLENGAGQVRACSRLAFRSKLAESGLKALEREMDALFPVQGSQYQQGVRVLVVSSLAGGTGSGIFLQVAMNIRDIMATRFERDKILIRGAFILPDVLIKCGRLADEEHEQVRANAYASVKELNAITRAAWGSWGDYPGVTVDLEYKPDQVDLEGRTVHAITLSQLPYDFCFLYDYENASGENLKGSLNSYMDQVARSVYIQLFSPIADNQFSQEDNQIRSSIRDGGLDIYCGSGVSTLVYPYEHIIEYCALKWGISGLDESWLLLDKIFQDEKKAYELDIQMGRPREELKRGQRYVDNLNTKLQGENPSPFLRYVERQVRVIDDKGNKGKYKADLFIDAIKHQVELVLEGDDVLHRLETRYRPDPVRIKVKDKAVAEISQVESRLEELRREIERKVPEHRTMVYYEVMGLDAQSVDRKETREYSLNTWMLAKNRALHPVAVRYVLYQIEIRLEQMLNDLRIRNEDSRETIQAYRKGAFNLADTAETETAARRVEIALKQGFVGSLFKNQFNEFIDEYMQKSNSQRSVLVEYKNNYLLELLCTSLLKDIRAMIAQWERFFDNLAETRSSLLNEANRRERQYDNPLDPTMDYVLATMEMMNKLWERFKGNLVSEVLPEEISEQIYLALYRYYVHTVRGEVLEPIKVEILYREQVLSYCRQALKERYAEGLDMNVVRALREEARLKGYFSSTDSEYLEQRIKPQLRQALPFIPPSKEIRELIYWGLHPDSNQELGESLCNSVFGGVQIADSAFSKYEICAYQAHYGLLAEQFSKFSSGYQSDAHKIDAGSYFAAYKKLVDRLVKEGPDHEVTPHLDKRWHLSAFLPPIDMEGMAQDLERIDRTFILGTIYGFLNVVKEQGIWVYQFNGYTNSLLMMNGDWVKGYPAELYSALGHNPAIIEYVLAQSTETRLNDVSRRLPMPEHRFISGALNIGLKNNPDLVNILDMVLDLRASEIGNIMNGNTADRLLKCLLEEIEKYYLDVYGSHRDIMAKKDAGQFILNLWNNSAVQKQADQDSATFNKWIKIIDSFLSKLGLTEGITSSAR